MLFCFPLQAFGTLDVNGIISTDGSWTLADSPIRITGNVLIEQTATLTIEPGVQVIFQPRPDTSRGYTITVDGALTARGSRTLPIVFTAQDRTLPWGALLFQDTSLDWDEATSSGSILEYCVVEYGGNDPDTNAMIATINALPLISSNSIRFSRATGISAIVSASTADIFSPSGFIRIVSNQIYNNSTGVLLSTEGGLVADNYFLNNSRAIDVQGRTNDVQIVNNTIISSAPQLFGTGIRLQVVEPASGITAYQWMQTSGTPVTLQNPQSPQASFSAPDPGNNLENLSFALTVTDKNNLQSTKNVDITVIGNNEPPVARAGFDQNVRLPQTAGQVVVVTLNGIASSDPNLGIAGYRWAQLAGTPVLLQQPVSAICNFTVPASTAAGQRMTFQLTVTDQGGLQSTDTVDIVFYQNNIYPIAAAGEDKSVVQGDTVNLDGSLSSDPDGGISTYSWTQVGGSNVTLVNPNSAKPSFTAPLTNGNEVILTFQLYVTDTGGLQGTDTIAVTVTGPLIADPGNDQTVNAGDQVVLDGSGSIDRNAYATVEIKANFVEADNPSAGLLAISAADNATFQLAIFENNFSLQGNDGYIVYIYDWPEDWTTISLPYNWWGTNDTLTIDRLIYDQKKDYRLPTVLYQPLSEHVVSGSGSSLPHPPIADAGPDQVVTADQSVTLDGSSSFNPNGVARYHWQQTDGPAVFLKNADQATATFAAPLGGADGDHLQFQLTVSTGNVFSHSDTCAVTVSPDEIQPTVDVGGCFLQSAASSSAMPFPSGAALAVVIFFGVVAFAANTKKRGLLLGAFELTVMIALASPAQAGYFAVGGGGGGEADQYNVTCETGAKDIHAGDLNLLFGMAIPFIPHSDRELPESTISFPCPNNDYIRLDSVKKGTEVGLLGKLGIEIGSTNLYLTAIGGCTIYTESELARSTITGRTYEQSSESKIGALYGGGLSYFPDFFNWSILMQVDYDNVRGVTGTVGWYW